MYRSNKDSGWSWVVCCGSFIAFLLETGIVKALRLLLPSLKEQFSTNTWVIGLIISLAPGFGAITSFSFGAEAITTAALPIYFDKFYDTSNGITHAGISISFMILPPLTQFLLDTYGWRGTLLILGGLNLHLVLCGALLRPLKISKIDYNHDSINDLSLKRTAFTSTTLVNKLKNLVQYMDPDLLKRSSFLNLLCMVTTSGYCFTGWVIYFVPHCEDLGFLPFKSALLATIGGVGYLAGTIVFPIAGRVLSAKTILYVSAVVMTLALATDSVMRVFNSYIGIMLSSFAVNIGFAVSFCCVFKELVVVVEEDKLSNAVNWIFVGYSIGSISSGFLSGWLYDRFGNYIKSFLFLSVVSALSVTPWLASGFKKAIKRSQRRDYSIIKDTDIKLNKK
ncbi:monocarboxylate transporter 12-like [Amphiura filiformis]|uniref:monocarboxylate transporter 12-like n=1 Tax=Amphiura filiformis TaxID=82378 RepID=UPI003B20CDB1